ncbi:MAG: hypothetical protein ACRC1R_06525 [Cetobacterium sp.]|uniref:hypothetical protein n=1 Tax=Cetobacterium sp. TaxID=2071632 RepID=UPI003F3EBA71
MRKKYLFLLLAISSIYAHGEQIFHGEHFTGVEHISADIKGNNSAKTGNTYNNSFILGKGKYDFINYPQDYEGFFKYDVRYSDDKEHGDIGYTALGGRYQYNGWGKKGVVLGIKGALDHDNFYEKPNPYYRRYMIEDDYYRITGPMQDYENFGFKFFGEFFKKLPYGFTVGLWNDLVFARNSNQSQVTLITNEYFSAPNNPYDNKKYATITVTPRIIYETKFFKDEAGKFVFEAYMENRQYYNSKFEVNKKYQDKYYKYIVNPQFVFSRTLGNWNFFNYSAFENEKFQYLDYWQHVFKTTPKIEYKKDKIKLGFAGGGYEFKDQIGMTFDNDEFFSYKKADQYSAWMISPKAYIEYNIYKNYSIGNEIIYRKGQWKTKTERQDFNEQSYIFYWKYEKQLKDNIYFLFKNSYEIYKTTGNLPKERMLPSEHDIRFLSGFKVIL